MVDEHKLPAAATIAREDGRSALKLASTNLLNSDRSDLSL